LTPTLVNVGKKKYCDLFNAGAFSMYLVTHYANPRTRKHCIKQSVMRSRLLSASRSSRRGRRRCDSLWQGRGYRERDGNRERDREI